jgi:hypothetical protein
MSTRAVPAVKPAVPPSWFTPAPFGLLQRKCACGGSMSSGSECDTCKDKKEEEGPSLQRSPSRNTGGGSAPPIVQEVLRSPGKPLDGKTRAFFERRFAHDFSKVRVHTDEQAARSADAVHAHAYTVGSDIVFGAARYAPETPAGKKLLAHELAHVVQQGQAAPRSAGQGATVEAGARGSATKSNRQEGRLTVNQPGDRHEREADHAASQVMRAPEFAPTQPPPLRRAGEAGVLQRDAWDDVVSDVSGAVEEAGQAAQEVGSAVVSGAEAAGQAVASGVQSAVQAGSNAIDWLKTQAGNLALSEANALASLYGGKITIGRDGIIIEIPDIRLLDAKHDTLIPSRGSIFLPILPAGFEIKGIHIVGALGVRLTAPSLTASLGPGGIRNVRIRIDPFSSAYSASGQAYVSGSSSEVLDAAPAIQGKAKVKLPSDPPTEVDAAVEGGLRFTLRGSGRGSLTDTVVLAYSGGRLTLNQDFQLKLGGLIEASADAYLDFLVQDEKICGWVWPKGSRRASVAEQYDLPLHMGLGVGGPSLTLGPVTSRPIPIDDIEAQFDRSRPVSKGCRPLKEIFEDLCKKKKLPAEVCNKKTPTVPPILPPGVLPPVHPPIGPHVGPNVGPVPAGPGGACPAPPPAPVILYLPAFKAGDFDIYDRWMSKGPLQHRVNRPRDTGQLRRWRALMPGRIPATVKQRAQKLGLSETDLILPYWSKSQVLTTPMQVDHIVEMQVAPIGREGELDNMANYRLMDGRQNASVGSELSANVRNLRGALQKRGGAAWETCDLTFDRVTAPYQKIPFTWTKEELQAGAHLDAFDKRLGKPPRP